MQLDDCRPEMRVKNLREAWLGIGLIIGVRKNWKIGGAKQSLVQVQWSNDYLNTGHLPVIWHPAKVLEEVA